MSPLLTVGTVGSHQEALEECKALAQTWLAEPGATLPEVVASGGTTGERAMCCFALWRMQDAVSKQEKLMQRRLQPLQYLYAVGELAAKLEHIMKSEYFTIQPQVQQMQQVCRTKVL